jgi:hypothetical protein
VDVSPYTVTALGYQWALREHGKLVKVYDTKEEAEQARREAPLSM